MSNLGKQHWEEIKWNLRYLRGTSDRDIMFSTEQTVPSVVGYVDSDYVGDLDDRQLIRIFSLSMNCTALELNL